MTPSRSATLSSRPPPPRYAHTSPPLLCAGSGKRPPSPSEDAIHQSLRLKAFRYPFGAVVGPLWWAHAHRLSALLCSAPLRFRRCFTPQEKANSPERKKQRKETPEKGEPQEPDGNKKQDDEDESSSSDEEEKGESTSSSSSSSSEEEDSSSSSSGEEGGEEKEATEQKKAAEHPQEEASTVTKPEGVTPTKGHVRFGPDGEVQQVDEKTLPQQQQQQQQQFRWVCLLSDVLSMARCCVVWEERLLTVAITLMIGLWPGPGPGPRSGRPRSTNQCWRYWPGPGPGPGKGPRTPSGRDIPTLLSRRDAARCVRETGPFCFSSSAALEGTHPLLAISLRSLPSYAGLLPSPSEHTPPPPTWSSDLAYASEFASLPSPFAANGHDARHHAHQTTTLYSPSLDWKKDTHPSYSPLPPPVAPKDYSAFPSFPTQQRNPRVGRGQAA